MVRCPCAGSSIHTDRDGDPVTVDVALPSGAPVGELLPAIVDLVDGRAAPRGRGRALAAGPRGRWRRWTTSLSLADNGVHDGELLILSRGHDAAPGPSDAAEPWHAAVIACPPDGRLAGQPSRRLLRTALCRWPRSRWRPAAGSAHATTQPGRRGGGSLRGRGDGDGHRVRHGVEPSAFACLAAATGFLAVPSAPAAPNVFLAAAAALAASLSMMRLSGRVVTGVDGGRGALAAGARLATVADDARRRRSAPSLSTAPRWRCSPWPLGSRSRRQARSRPVGPPDARPATWRIASTTAHAILDRPGRRRRRGQPPRARWSWRPSCRGGRVGRARRFTAVLALVLLLRARTYVDPCAESPWCAGGFVAAAPPVLAGLGSSPGATSRRAGGALVAVGLVAAAGPAGRRVVVTLARPARVRRAGRRRSRRLLGRRRVRRRRRVSPREWHPFGRRIAARGGVGGLRRRGSRRPPVP